MSKKRRDKDFLGDINEAMNLVGLYTKKLAYKELPQLRKQVKEILKQEAD